MKARRILAFVFSLVALILEILPYGAVLNFADDGGETIRKTFSYFSMIPFGYANFSPLFTAILTALLFVFCLLFLVKKSEKSGNTAFLLSVAGAIFSIFPLFLGLRFYNWVSLLITLCLGACVLCLWRKVES